MTIMCTSFSWIQMWVADSYTVSQHVFSVETRINTMTKYWSAEKFCCQSRGQKTMMEDLWHCHTSMLRLFINVACFTTENQRLHVKRHRVVFNTTYISTTGSSENAILILTFIMIQKRNKHRLVNMPQYIKRYLDCVSFS